MAEVVLVEDDVPLRNSLADCLTLMGHRAREAGSAVELYQLMAEHTFDVAVIDVNLPYHDGYSIARHLSSQTDVGIILTTVRDALNDRVRGYHDGADIYMVKPVEPEELAAAISGLAHKKRAGRAPAPDQPAAWRYSARTQALRSPGDRPVRLTRREARFVEHLIHAPQPVASRKELCTALGDDMTSSASRKLDAMVCRLRAKVLEGTGETLPVSTVQGAGFSLAADIQII